MALLSTGSRVASMSEPRFSMMSAWPFTMAVSTVLSHFFCVSWITTRSFFSFSLSHLMPWVCGSMMSGQRLQLLMMLPFSTLILSLGRPWLIIWDVRLSSVIMSSGSEPGVMGIFFSSRSGIHVVFHSCSLRSASNAPQYDTKPAASMQSPVRVSEVLLSLSISMPQRSFSEASPPTSLFARSSFCSRASALSSTSCFSLTANSYLRRVFVSVVSR